MRQKDLITDSQALIKAVALSNVERTLAFSRKMLAKNKRSMHIHYFTMATTGSPSVLLIIILL